MSAAPHHQLQTANAALFTIGETAYFHRSNRLFRGIIRRIRVYFDVEADIYDLEYLIEITQVDFYGWINVEAPAGQNYAWFNEQNLFAQPQTYPVEDSDPSIGYPDSSDMSISSG